MVKKASEKPEADATDKVENSEASIASIIRPIKPDLGKPEIQRAIAEGKAIIAEGKSKADAARAIFSAIATEDKEIIVAAFVEGATLTEKGALTYWYNCRRKAEKAGK